RRARVLSANRALIAAAWSPRACLEEPRLVREHDCLDAVTEVELLEDVRDVCLDSGVADVEVLCDLCVGEAVDDQAKDLLFTRGQVVELLGRRGTWDARELFDYTFRDRG